MTQLLSVDFTRVGKVRPGTRLEFPRQGAVLLGRNGSGKTTLLEYVSALCRLDAAVFASDEGFDVAATFALSRGEQLRIRLFSKAQEHQTVPMEMGPHNLARMVDSREAVNIECELRVQDGR